MFNCCFGRLPSDVPPSYREVEDQSIKLSQHVNEPIKIMGPDMGSVSGSSGSSLGYSEFKPREYKQSVSYKR
jgi:hypothetical protein